MKRYLASLRHLLLAALLVASLLPAPSAYAAGNVLYVLPSSNQFTAGATFSVTVRGYADVSQDSGTAVGGLRYPTNLLQVASTSGSGSAYGNPSINVNGGTISFNASRSPAPAGQRLIFTVNFKAIAAGTANLSFTANSSINGAPTTLNNASYTINAPPAPAPAPTPAPAPAPAPAPTPAPAPAPAPTPEPEPEPKEDEPEPDASGVIDTVASVTKHTSAAVTWKLTVPGATAEFAYGTSRSSTTTKVEVSRLPDGSFTATAADLKAGLRYYFTITSKTPAGKTSAYNGSFVTQGYPVTVAALNGTAPASGATIRIGQRSYSTGKEGSVALSLAAGKYSGLISSQGATKNISFTVVAKPIPTDGSAPEKQIFSFALDITTAQTGTSGDKSGATGAILTFIGVLIAGSALLGAGVLLFMYYRRRKMEQEAGYGSVSGGAVIIDDGYEWQPPGTPTAQPHIPPPPPPPIAPTSHSSVYLDEEMPKDMFELAEEQQKRPT